MVKCFVDVCEAVRCVHNDAKQCTLESVNLGSDWKCKQFKDAKWMPLK